MSAFVRKCDDEDSDEEADCVTVAKRSYSADCIKDQVEEEGMSDSDSDAEFLVHPCLRSLIKSKSYYHQDRLSEEDSARKMKTSKTSFEISLQRMFTSTSKSLAEEHEYCVADLLPTIDERWPDPEEMTRGRRSTVVRYSPSISDPSVEMRIEAHHEEEEEKEEDRDVGCWSAPPNFYQDSCAGRATPINQKCWSAPEICDYPDACPQIFRELTGSGYPIIETPDNDPSVCSYRLPSAAGSAADDDVSPSPPRPLSPVFGRPAPANYRMHASRSMHLPRRPDIEAFLANVSDDVAAGFTIGSTSESSESPAGDEVVWPVEANRHVRRGWFAPRSATMQFANEVDDVAIPQIHVSRSAHSQLHNWGAEESEEDIDDDEEEDEEEVNGALVESEHSQLDEEERRALTRRQEWMQRGSIVRLETPPTRQPTGVQSQYGSYSSLSECVGGGAGGSAAATMRRSCTTDEFRRAHHHRRRLPRRPDEIEFEHPLMATSRSMTMGGEIIVVRRPPTLALQRDEQQHTINTIIESKRSNAAPPNMDPYAHLETPLSPHAVLPSPSPSGRRLPPLPVNSAVLLRRIPHNMSIPPQPPVKNIQDHTLCFMDGMADSVMDRSGAMDDSYYEEDGLNGNNNQRKRRNAGRRSFFSPDDSSGVSSCTTSDSQNPTHRVQSSFHPRHQDEVMLEIGDAVHVDRSADDHWSYGTNLRTGQSGIFPSAVVCEIDIVDEICMGAMPSNTAKIMNDERDTFYLTMLASIEVAHHKGNDVLVQAMNKVLSMYKNAEEIIVPQTVLMEISFRGIHVIDKRKKNFFQCPMFDFFFSLQNISFCGAHPKQLKYFGFITKHPLLPRFACHVFMSTSSTQPIVESIGRAFKRSYDEYMAFAHPTEDIYLE